MALIYWRDDCQTNHPQIDDEHQEILTILKLLYQDVMLHESDDSIRSTLDALFIAFLDHSEVEEALMRQYNYPDIRIHIDDHEIILSAIFNLRLRVEHHGLKLNQDMIHDLTNCINKHTWEYDLIFVQYIQAEDRLNSHIDILDKLDSSDQPSYLAG